MGRVRALLDSSAMRSREYDQEFRDRATLTRSWGIGLLSLACLQWIWCSVLILMPYQADSVREGRSPSECESRLFTEYSTANQGRQNGYYCQAERDWPEIVAVLGLSIPVSIAGVGLFTIGTVTRRMSAHGQAMRELDKYTPAPQHEA